MTARLAFKLRAVIAPFTLVLAAFLTVFSWQNYGALARFPASQQQIALGSDNAPKEMVPTRTHDKNVTRSSLPDTLDALLDAIGVMQEKYFEVSTGTWPSSIDWTAAVLGTHISATLSTLISSIKHTPSITCAETLAWDNLINLYFSHTSLFYFGENALSLRQQAYDDMLWVVLGWLENIKVMNLYSSARSNQTNTDSLQRPWYGMQFKPSRAHRARIFYDIAAHGWDTSLCNGGMVWNPYLRPYKNAITNELFISASISMYLYFPGDDNESPFITTPTIYSQFGDSKSAEHRTSKTLLPHDPLHRQNAIQAYEWLKSSNLTNPYNGLYADGYHISGWHRHPDGHIDPGTRRCDDLNTMVYTYNQGVVLTGLRGLWLATGSNDYLEDGHELIESVVATTGWPDTESMGWRGLGRAGVLEEYCDSSGNCNQNGQTFKGIFFHHLAEFCRDMWGFEQQVASEVNANGQLDDKAWEHHLRRCAGYRGWVEHNAQAAVQTRDGEGRFGSWWGRCYPNGGAVEDLLPDPPPMPPGAVDYANYEDDDDAADRADDHTPPSCLGRDGRTASASTGTRTRRRIRDVNARGRGRTVETQSGGLAVLRALWQWEGVARKKRGEGVGTGDGMG